MLRVLDLFSGIGGFALGLESTGGFRTVAFCEIEPFCREVLRKHWPEVPIADDVRLLMGGDVAGKLKKLTEEQATEAVRMYERGLSCGDVAKFYGVSRQSMWDLLRRRTTMRQQLRYGEDNHFHRGGAVADPYAHNLVEEALEKGVLVRPEVCEECGSSGSMADGRTTIQGHHDDYNKPLDVRWLCQKCHHEWHSKNTPIPREVPKEVNDEQIDMIVGGFPERAKTSPSQEKEPG